MTLRLVQDLTAAEPNVVFNDLSGAVGDAIALRFNNVANFRREILTVVSFVLFQFTSFEANILSVEILHSNMVGKVGVVVVLHVRYGRKYGRLGFCWVVLILVRINCQGI